MLKIYLYDDQLNPEGSPNLEIKETNNVNANIDRAFNAKIGTTDFGAKLSHPSTAEPIIVVVDDITKHFATTSIGSLHGKLTVRLDIPVFPLPVAAGGHGDGGDFEDDDGGGGGGGGVRIAYKNPLAPQTPGEIAAYIDRKVETEQWTRSEGIGVRRLVETVVLFMNIPSLEQDMQERFERWCKTLNDLGITIAAENRGGGGGFQNRSSHGSQLGGLQYSG